MPAPKIIVALDYPDAASALSFVRQVSPQLCALKIGKELFTATGPSLVEQLVQQGFNVFLDLKYHDIPHTVAKACLAAANLGVWMLNVHALGGAKMLTAAREAVNTVSGNKPLLIGVTILTSLQNTDLPAVGINGSAAENVLRLAELSQQAGLDGVVCSPQEVATLRSHCGTNFCLVTPGIRPVDYGVNDDQQRTMTATAAVHAGVNYLVIGRPITQAGNPSKTLLSLAQNIN